MTDQSARTFSSDFKRFFIRGLAVLLPSILTLWILVQGYLFVDRSIADPINTGLKTALVNVARVWTPLQEMFNPTDEQVSQRLTDQGKSNPSDADRAAMRERLRSDMIWAWWDQRWYMNLVGLLAAIVAVYVAGRLLGGFFGRRIYTRIERFFVSLPIINQVYPYVKRVVDFLFSEEKTIKFNRVVVVEYPRKGIWSIGFLTGPALKSICDHAGDSVTVFVPCSPAPITGYTITVPKRDVIELAITVEEAVMFTVSGGVLIPPHQIVNGAAKEAAIIATPPRPPLAAAP